MISLFVRGEMSECIGLHGFYSQVLDVYRTIIMFAGTPKGQPCILKDINFLPSVWCIIFAVFDLFDCWIIQSNAALSGQAFGFARSFIALWISQIYAGY